MCLALYIAGACLVFISKGVPIWALCILQVVESGCVAYAIAVWEHTQSRIKTLEKELAERKSNEKL